MSILEKHVKATFGANGYGVKLTCDGSSEGYIMFDGGSSRGKKEEKKLLIERGLKKAQEEYNG